MLLCRIPWNLHFWKNGQCARPQKRMFYIIPVTLFMTNEKLMIHVYLFNKTNLNRFNTIFQTTIWCLWMAKNLAPPSYFSLVAFICTPLVVKHPSNNIIYSQLALYLRRKFGVNDRWLTLLKLLCFYRLLHYLAKHWN